MSIKTDASVGIKRTESNYAHLSVQIKQRFSLYRNCYVTATQNITTSYRCTWQSAAAVKIDSSLIITMTKKLVDKSSQLKLFLSDQHKLRNVYSAAKAKHSFFCLG